MIAIVALRLRRTSDQIRVRNFLKDTLVISKVVKRLHTSHASPFCAATATGARLRVPPPTMVRGWLQAFELDPCLVKLRCVPSPSSWYTTHSAPLESSKAKGKVAFGSTPGMASRLHVELAGTQVPMLSAAVGAA